MHSKDWARQVVEWVQSADWTRVLAAIASADATHLDLLEALLVQEDLLWRLNDHLPRAIRQRRQSLNGHKPNPATGRDP
jgi:hypothetical protein